MNIIFLTVSRIDNFSERGIYSDLLRYCQEKGHEVWVVNPRERKFQLPSSMEIHDGIHVIGVKTPNIQKTNVIEKGLSTLLLGRLYIRAIKRYAKDVSFDLILYSTPPITFTNVVSFLKKKNPHAISYLLLKDIFPQNAVDLGMFKKNGLIYKYFRRKEKSLYVVSDYIGCMSPANVAFVRKNNSNILPEKVEVAPNSIRLLSNDRNNPLERDSIRTKYGLPFNIPVFIYGGNLGKPQGIDFLIQCLDENKNRKDCCFVIVGNGTEYHKLATWRNNNPSCNTFVLQRLPKTEYDQLVYACDIGLIFLDHHFTIPNFPSRLLAYLENSMPVICATDPNTDIGKIAQDNEFGYWCESNNTTDFTSILNKFISHPERIKIMGEKGYGYLCQNYLVQNTYDTIMNHLA